MSWEGKVYVTESNPSPGQLRPVEGLPAKDGAVEIPMYSDQGIGINSYIAGGNGPNGTVPVTIYEAGTGAPTRYEPNGFLAVAQPTRLVGGNHEGYVLDTIRWATSSLSGGNVLYEGKGYATITPGTGSGGSATLMTAQNARYLTPFHNFVCIVAKLSDEGVSGSLRRWGASSEDVSNHIGFEVSGTTKSLIIQRSGSDTLKFPMPADATLADQAHRYEIHWWRERVRWYKDGTLLHDYYPSGSDSTVLTSVSLHVRARSTNSALIAAGSGTIEIHEGSITRIGPKNAQPYWSHNPAGADGSRLLKKGAGTFFRVTLNGLSVSSNSAVVTFYDAASAADAVNGNAIAVIDTAKVTAPVTLNYELDFSRGLWVIAGSAAADFTAVFD